MNEPEQVPIKAVEFVRRIRDAQAEQLEGKTLEDRLAFYRQEGRKAQEELERLSRRKREGRQAAV